MVGKSVGLRKEVIECTTVDRIISRKLKENTKAGGGRQWEGEIGEGRQMHHDTNCIDSWNEYEAKDERSFTSLIAMQSLVPDHAFMPHMKAMCVPFHTAYSGLICSK